MSKLYIVGTPIGHLEDLGIRARRLLSSVAVIACEDTRVTKKLVDHYEIATPLTSVHHHSPDAVLSELLDRVAQGHDVAYVTDAGTPAIADPGGRLLELAHQRGIQTEVVPGPSALTAALALAGFPADQFLFLGFPPHKKGRQTLFRRIGTTVETVVLFESPHRLMKTLEALAATEPMRSLAVCRELTKIHESVIRANAADTLKYYQAHPDEVRGEIVIVIGPQ